MGNAIDSKIQELVAQYGYDAEILRDFAEFVQSQPKPRRQKIDPSEKPPKPKPAKPLTITQLQEAVVKAFECADLKALKKHPSFKLAIAGRDLNLKKKDAWLILYREWVGVPKNERNEQGATSINGIDVLKNFRPWHVFELDPKTATTEDIKTAFNKLAKIHHPDHGGNREVFEVLKQMRDSLLAFR